MLYSVVSLVNNVVLCTWKFIKGVDVKLSLLPQTTIAASQNKNNEPQEKKKKKERKDG